MRWKFGYLPKLYGGSASLTRDTDVGKRSLAARAWLELWPKAQVKAGIMHENPQSGPWPRARNIAQRRA
ncbi:hypothetical protein EH31_00995 [Erythrobacter longus]|uniref:Uncharacterized protein n=1 Tax=Erythrobacter longus TaxID=1044 RepID=A0A074MET4_ERYLO|nr:hypothetical protein EH31_00995 [Erythrobacter longus]